MNECCQRIGLEVEHQYLINQEKKRRKGREGRKGKEGRRGKERKRNGIGGKEVSVR